MTNTPAESSSANNSTNNSANNKRIAKNTLVLYTRSLISMLIAIYASRVVLNALGVIDYGIYTVVGGVISLLSILNSALNTGTQRFINYELGKGDIRSVNKVFSMSLTVHMLVSFVILVLAETVGLWFVNNKLQIPIDRMAAANWVYQCVVILSVANITQTPYTASIIANERMKAFASIGILDVFLRLIIAIVISFATIDRLQLYAVLMMSSGLITTLLYRLYCKFNLKGCDYRFEKNKELFKEIISFSGWNIFGATAMVASSQGVSIIFNIFFGVIVNAARGISTQVLSAISGLVSNFQIAMNPQIIQSYSVGNMKRVNTLIHSSAKVSFYLLLLISAPILCNTEYIFTLWLKNVPEHAVAFCQISIISTLINSFSLPLSTGVTASGKIKLYQITISFLVAMLLPLTYLAIKLGATPILAASINIIVVSTTLFARLCFARRLIKISFRKYTKEVVTAMFIMIVSISTTIVLRSFIKIDIIALLVTSLYVTITSCFLIYKLHLTQEEKIFIVDRFVALKNKLLKC